MNLRSQGERIRLAHSIARHRAQIDAIERALKIEGPIGGEMGQSIVQGALEIATQIAKHDAFDLLEEDVRAKSARAWDLYAAATKVARPPVIPPPPEEIEDV